LASAFDVPIVGLYSIIHPENAGPYFGDKKKQILFKSYERANLKPSYAAEENPKTINLIRPEEIAQAIFELLSLPQEIFPTTVHVGERYGKVQINDFIPNQVADIPNKDTVIDFRMDYLFNEQALALQLQRNKCRIFTDKPINLDLLQKGKAAIDSIFYFVGENDSPEFVSRVSDLGIKIALLSKDSPEVVQSKKINYYRLGNINLLPKPDPTILAKLKATPNLYYKSCQSIHSKGKIFPCLAAERLGLPKSPEFQPVIDNDLFWGEMENFYFVSKT
jgi:hypothetical protein